MPSSLSPDQVARQAERELKAAANVRTASQAKFYFKPGEEVWFFGVDTPTQRRIAGVLFQRVRGVWEIAEAVEFCDLLIKRREMELKNAGIFLLARYRKSYDKGLLRNVESWLANDHCANGAASGWTTLTRSLSRCLNTLKTLFTKPRAGCCARPESPIPPGSKAFC